MASLQAAPPEFVTLVMPHGWQDLSHPRNLQQLESDVIPAFLPRQRWSGAKDQRIRAASVQARGMITRPASDGSSPEAFLAAVVEAQLARGERARYFLPLAAIWSPSETELRQGLIPVTLSELRQMRREGALVDAMSQDGLVFALLDTIQREATVPLEGGEIRCRKTPSFERVAPPERFVVRRAGVEQSNSSVFFEEYGMLKTYRRLQPGTHPEIEMSRFLVERAGFANTPPLLATMELGSGSPSVGGGQLFTVIPAAVIGGTSLGGGEGGVLRSALGVFLLIILNNGLVLAGVNPDYQSGVFGAILVIAIVAVIGRRRRRAGGIVVVHRRRRP